MPCARRKARQAIAWLGSLLVLLGVGGALFVLGAPLAPGVHLADRSTGPSGADRSTGPSGAAPPLSTPVVATVAIGPTNPAPEPTPAAPAPTVWVVDAPTAAPIASAERTTPAQTQAPSPTPVRTPLPTAVEPDPFVPITRVLLPRTRLDAEVVPAELVDKDGSSTWQVPAFKAGHAQGTAGAGEVGNAVLLGHVTSRQSGNVFQRLDAVRVDDAVKVFSGSVVFDYRVVEVKSVPRTDVAVLDPTETPTISLITCTGAWNPLIWDYMERLVVRAELVG